MKYYLAYGMNTNIASMATRCPAAQSLGKVTLDNHRLQFKYHCDVEFVIGESMECVLWLITEECERRLDALEGYPHYYGKKETMITHNGKTIRPMIYYMKEYTDLEIPSYSYFDMVSTGYKEHGLSLDQLEDALNRIEKCTLSPDQQLNTYETTIQY